MSRLARHERRAGGEPGGEVLIAGLQVSLFHSPMTCMLPQHSGTSAALPAAPGVRFWLTFGHHLPLLHPSWIVLNFKLRNMCCVVLSSELHGLAWSGRHSDHRARPAAPCGRFQGPFCLALALMQWCMAAVRMELDADGRGRNDVDPLQIHFRKR